MNVEELKEKHGKLAVIETEDGQEFAFKKPARRDYERFQSAVSADRARIPTACRELARATLVWPAQGDRGDVVALEAALEDAPGLMDELMPLLHELAKKGAAGKVV